MSTCRRMPSKGDDSHLDGVDGSEATMSNDARMQAALLREHPERYTPDYSTPGTRSPQRLVPATLHGNLKSGIDG